MAGNLKGRAGQVVDKEARQVGKQIGNLAARVTGKYKPEEISFFKTFFSDFIKSPKARMQAQLERQGAQRISNAYDEAITQRAAQNIKEFENLSAAQRAYAQPLLKGRAYANSLRKTGEEAAEKAREHFQKYMTKELENIPGWGGVIKNGLQGVANSKITKYGLVAGLPAYGIYKGIFGNTPEAKDLSDSNYRWTPDNGWQQRDDDGNWNNQQEEFGVDRFGNTNFYDTETGQWYSDYIQGSDGSIYDRQGNLLGNVMPQGGNFFDYNAQQVAQELGKSSLSPMEIMALQQQLGVTPDGLIGARTLNAIAKQSGNPLKYFTIYS